MGTPGALRAASHQAAVYRRFWGVNVLNSLVQPLLYMLGLGVGVGALVDRNSESGAALGGASYVAYVAPGLLVTTAMTICAMEAMWPVMDGLKWSRSYYAVSATPLEAADIVDGHALWSAVRATIAAGGVAIILSLFTATRSWGLVPAVGVAALVGVAFAMPLMAYSASVESDSGGSFAAVNRFVIIPLFLFGGAFYPLTQLPTVVQWLAKAFPLWHGVVVARGATLGGLRWPGTLGHVAYIAAWIVVGRFVAVRRLRKRLYE
ncbi:MAG TPA: ABC transporter permease [Ilumatobacteraceae bacterium]|nr:ABC transporter permease [Ilumatobacteraceae bacterium]